MWGKVRDSFYLLINIIKLIFYSIIDLIKSIWNLFILLYYKILIFFWNCVSFIINIFKLIKYCFDFFIGSIYYHFLIFKNILYDIIKILKLKEIFIYCFEILKLDKFFTYCIEILKLKEIFYYIIDILKIKNIYNYCYNIINELYYRKWITHIKTSQFSEDIKFIKSFFASIYDIIKSIWKFKIKGTWTDINYYWTCKFIPYIKKIYIPKWTNLIENTKNQKNNLIDFFFQLPNIIQKFCKSTYELIIKIINFDVTSFILSTKDLLITNTTNLITNLIINLTNYILLTQNFLIINFTTIITNLINFILLIKDSIIKSWFEIIFFFELSKNFFKKIFTLDWVNNLLTLNQIKLNYNLASHSLIKIFHFYYFFFEWICSKTFVIISEYVYPIYSYIIYNIINIFKKIYYNNFFEILVEIILKKTFIFLEIIMKIIVILITIISYPFSLMKLVFSPCYLAFKDIVIDHLCMPTLIYIRYALMRHFAEMGKYYDKTFDFILEYGFYGAILLGIAVTIHAPWWVNGNFIVFLICYILYSYSFSKWWFVVIYILWFIFLKNYYFWRILSWIRNKQEEAKERQDKIWTDTQIKLYNERIDRQKQKIKDREDQEKEEKLQAYLLRLKTEYQQKSAENWRQILAMIIAIIKFKLNKIINRISPVLEINYLFFIQPIIRVVYNLFLKFTLKYPLYIYIQINGFFFKIFRKYIQFPLVFILILSYSLFYLLFKYLYIALIINLIEKSIKLIIKAIYKCLIDLYIFFNDILDIILNPKLKLKFSKSLKKQWDYHINSYKPWKVKNISPIIIIISIVSYFGRYIGFLWLIIKPKLNLEVTYIITTLYILSGTLLIFAYLFFCIYCDLIEFLCVRFISYDLIYQQQYEGIYSFNIYDYNSEYTLNSKFNSNQYCHKTMKKLKFSNRILGNMNDPDVISLLEKKTPGSHEMIKQILYSDSAIKKISQTEKLNNNMIYHLPIFLFDYYISKIINYLDYVSFNYIYSFFNILGDRDVNLFFESVRKANYICVPPWEETIQKRITNGEDISNIFKKMHVPNPKVDANMPVRSPTWPFNLTKD
jgi:hypothetical protein